MSPSAGSGEPKKLGTFGGVFTPSVLTILGLILFLRMGFVTGSVGLGPTLLILALSTSVSVLTTMSLAAIATNLRVRGGGVYFLISRSLGPTTGGAIGLVLYVSIAVSVGFYAIGFGEALASVVDTESSTFPRLVAAAVIFALLGLAWLGADIATRFQYVVMACLVVALVAYFAGVADELSFDRVGENLTRDDGGGSFWTAFALFFPAITGFTQGVAMSGDLRTPSTSIARGTFGAIGLSTAIYLAVIVSFAMAVPLDALRGDTAIMRSLAIAPGFVDVGVIAATLSSAIASMLGAPRTIQRLAADQLVKPLAPLGVGVGPDDNPRRALVLTAAIAFATVALGDLDAIAPVISMFFLATFGMINYATFAESRAANTSFRPTFRLYGPRLSFLGAVACVGAALAINPVAGALAGAAVFGLHRYLGRTVTQGRWEDATHGFHASEVRSHLLQMRPTDHTERERRPFTVAFVPRDPERRQRLMTVATWFEGRAGFTTALRILSGRGPIARKHAARVDVELGRETSESHLPVFGRVMVAPDPETGVQAALQVHGLGPLRPNLALFNLPGETNGQDQVAEGFGDMLQAAVRLECNAGLVHVADGAWRAHEHRGRATITVWWADDRSGQLLTMLAWLCTRATEWAEARIRVVVDGVDAGHVTRLLEDARIEATVVDEVDPADLGDAVDRDGLVLAPLRLRRGMPFGPRDLSVAEFVQRIPLAVMVHVATRVDLDVQPDEGSVAALAEAQDHAARTEQRARELDAEASAKIVAAELVRRADGEDEHGFDDRLASADAEAEAEAAYRRYLDARTRADEARRLVREISPLESTEEIDPEIWQQHDREP